MCIQRESHEKKKKERKVIIGASCAARKTCWAAVLRDFDLTSATTKMVKGCWQICFVEVSKDLKGPEIH